MKKNRGDEPIGVIIHTHMEISQENSLCSYIYIKQEKMSFFLFSSTKSEHRRTKQVLSRDGLVSVGGGRKRG
jgi:hypothetical protein